MANKKIYDNPYLNGNRETPGGDDDDNDNNRDGEESDEIVSDDDENDIIQQPNFTLGDESDESDEEKDNMNHNRNKKAKKAVEAHQQPLKQMHCNPPKTNSFLNTYSMSIISVVCCFIAVYYGIHNRSTTTKPDPPKFHCPPSIIYAPLNGKEFYINASR